MQSCVVILKYKLCSRSCFVFEWSKIEICLLTLWTAYNLLMHYKAISDKAFSKPYKLLWEQWEGGWSFHWLWLAKSETINCFCGAAHAKCFHRTANVINRVCTTIKSQIKTFSKHQLYRAMRSYDVWLRNVLFWRKACWGNHQSRLWNGLWALFYPLQIGKTQVWFRNKDRQVGLFRFFK